MSETRANPRKTSEVDQTCKSDRLPKSTGAWLSFLAALLVATGCGGADKAKKPESPAHVFADEKGLSTIVLAPEAEAHLAVKTVRVELKKDVRRQRTVGGEVLVPPGQAIIVAAPVNGTLSIPEGARLRRSGETVAEGDRIFSFVPLLSPERAVLTPAEQVNLAQAKASLATSQIEAQRQVESAKVQVEAARTAFTRATQLLRDRAGSQRAVDETQAQFHLAQEALKTAEARHNLLASITLDVEAGKQTPREIAAPVGGFLRAIHAAPGETVAAGKPLFEVVQNDLLWIRVPIYVGWWRDVADDEDALFVEFGQRPDTTPRRAKPAEAPHSADALAATVDLFYETANEGDRLRPGQKLSVTVSMKQEEPGLVVPLAAVIYDIHGNAWVYEQTAPLTYVRRLVRMRFIDRTTKGPARAVVESGIKEGAEVVTDGAPELYGAELGFAK